MSVTSVSIYRGTLIADVPQWGDPSAMILTPAIQTLSFDLKDPLAAVAERGS